MQKFLSTSLLLCLAMPGALSALPQKCEANHLLTPASWYPQEVYGSADDNFTFRMVDHEGIDQIVHVIPGGPARLRQLQSLFRRVRDRHLESAISLPEIFSGTALAPLIKNVGPWLAPDSDYAALKRRLDGTTWYSREDAFAPHFVAEWGATQRARFAERVRTLSEILKSEHLVLEHPDFSVAPGGEVTLFNFEDARVRHRLESGPDLAKLLSNKGFPQP